MRNPTSMALWCGAALSLLAGLHCGDDSTGRTRVAFSVGLRGIAPSAATSTGWTVTLDQAFVTVGPVRWFEGEPLLSRRFLRALSVGTAFAHPGHYVPGEALADITETRSADLLAGATELGPANGVSGTARSASVGLRPASGPAMQGRALWLRGTAQREGRTVRFEGGLTAAVDVTGVPARGELQGSLGRWDLAIDLQGLLDRADFSTLPAPATADGYAPLGEETQAANALYRAATSGLSYRLHWSPDGRDR